jgi:hypothetical protein
MCNEKGQSVIISRLQVPLQTQMCNENHRGHLASRDASSNIDVQRKRVKSCFLVS